MTTLKSKLRKVRTSMEGVQILREEFAGRMYLKTRKGASDFQRDLEKEFPGINRWVLGWNRESGREIEDVIMDEFNIQ